MEGTDLRSSVLFASLGLFCCLTPYDPRSAAQQVNDPQATAPTMQLDVNRVLVPVVVRDKMGRTVDGLKKEDFQVIDNGKQRAVSGFSVQLRGPIETNQPTPSQPRHHLPRLLPRHRRPLHRVT